MVMEQATAKELKEAFVAGTDGTSVDEINAIIAVVPLAAFVFRYLVRMRRLAGLTSIEYGKAMGLTSTRTQQPPAIAAVVLLEFYITLLPVICAMMGVVS